jgi:hypothetical protein
LQHRGDAVGMERRAAGTEVREGRPAGRVRAPFFDAVKLVGRVECRVGEPALEHEDDR